MPVLRAKQEITDAMLVFQMCYMTNARRTENHGRRFMEILAVRRLIVDAARVQPAPGAVPLGRRSHPAHREDLRLRADTERAADDAL
ncbi:MAG TPA: hypothetical protein VJ044_13845, partial [Candidatus Hodarchaeales archaeon]|nr:hypothetical protein [Candidatus Hodarchaeales archaeon]